MTNTKVKFIIIVEETSIPLRENDIRMVIRIIRLWIIYGYMTVMRIELLGN
jgi:hypothetical protein